MNNHPPESNTNQSADASDAAADESSRRLAARAKDPFFANITTYTGDAPSDLSVNHDEYLYGDLA